MCKSNAGTALILPFCLFLFKTKVMYPFKREKFIPPNYFPTPLEIQTANLWIQKREGYQLGYSSSNVPKLISYLGVEE
jgi:hypothetical protein